MRRLLNYCGLTGKLVLIITMGTLGFGGCAVYKPLPLNSEILKKLVQSPPNMAIVRLQVDQLESPFGRTQPFDERNGLSPEEAALMAVVVNPKLMAVRDRRDLAAAQLMQAGILPNPQISYELTLPSGGNNKGNVNGFGLGVGWDIGTLFTLTSRQDNAKTQSAMVDLDVAWQELQIAAAARLHAYHLIVAGRRLTLMEIVEKSREELWSAINQGVSLGIKTRLDLVAVANRLQKSKEQLLNCQSRYQEERVAFNRALGVPAATVMPLEDKITLPRPQSQDLVADELFRGAQNRRLDLMALRLGYESHEARVREAVRAQFPNINLGFSAGKDTDSLRTIGFGVTIDLPLFDRNQAQIAKQRASRKILYDDYVTRLFTTRADIDHLIAAITGTCQQLDGLECSLDKAQMLCKNLHEALQAGQVDLVSYYDTLNRLNEKRLRRLELQQKLIDLGIGLEIASGDYGLLLRTGRPAQNL